MSSVARARIAAGLALVVSFAPIAGCGGETPRPRPVTTTTATTATPAPSAPPAALPDGTLRRSAVSRTVAAGLGAFLGRIALEDQPVMVGGRFRGFRVAALRGDPAFWRGVDLRPGDVVTRVNGMPIEHPEEALEVFKSLDVASELRVDVERDGAPRDLRFSIVDDVPVTRVDGGTAR